MAIDFINLTPHEISLDLDGARFGIAPFRDVNGNPVTARVLVDNIPINGLHVDNWHMWIPVVNQVYGDVEGLPPPRQGTAYIVSLMVAQRVPWRSDVYAPDSGPTAIRNAAGQIEAVKGLVSCYNPNYSDE